MELTEKNFNEYYKKEYEELNSAIEENLQEINELLRKHNEKELANPNIYVYNALVRTIKFVKKYNINYCGKEEESYEREIFYALEGYLQHLAAYVTLYLYGLNERIEYNKYNVINQFPYSLLFKTHILKESSLEREILINLKNQNCFKEYEEICNKLADFDPQKDLGDAFTLHLPKVLKQVIIYKKEFKDPRTINELYYSIIGSIKNKLEEINDPELMEKFNQAHIMTYTAYNTEVKELKKNKTI